MAFNFNIIPQNADYKPLIEAYPKAANIQSQAATNAANTATGYLQQGIGSLQGGGAQATQTVNPYLQAGQQAVGSLAGMTGAAGPAAQAAAYQNFQANPAYQFNLNEQLDSLQNYYGSRGKLYSGQAMKALQDRASGLASQEYNNQVNNQQNLLNSTNQFASGQASRDYQLGSDVAGTLGQIGSAQAGGILAAGGAQAGGILGAANAQSLSNSAPNVVQQPGSGLAAYNPAAVSNPWGSQITSGSGGSSLSSGGGMVSGGGSSGGSGLPSTDIRSNSYNPGQQPNTNTFSSSPTSPSYNISQGAGSYLSQPQDQSYLGGAGGYLSDNYTNQPTVDGGQGGSEAFNRVSGNLLDGTLNSGIQQASITNPDGSISMNTGSSPYGNPGGNVPEATWSGLQPAGQEKVSTAYNAAINSGASPYLQFQKMVEAARKLPGPEQNALIEAANAYALSSGLRD